MPFVDPILSGRTQTVTRDSGSFRNQWINFCLYLPQFLYITKNNPNRSQVCDFIMSNRQVRLKGNDQPLGGDQKDTINLANGDNFQTDFIHVDKRDIVNILVNVGNRKGFRSTIFPAEAPLFSAYRHQNNSGQGRQPENASWIYFFKGLFEADCFQFLRKKNII